MMVDRNRDITFSSPGMEESFSVTLERNRILYIKDIAAIQIVRDNFGRRPIYFAVTVADEIVFGEHLRNEGMVNRLVPSKGRDQLDLERMLHNVEVIYSYRSIFAEDVYKDDNMQKLVTNYGAAFMKLSQYYHQQNDLSNAAHYLEKAISFIREKERFYPGLIQLFMDAEEYDRAISVIDNALISSPRNLTLYVQAAFIHLERDSADAAFELFDRATEAGLFSEDLVTYIYLAAIDYDLIDQGIEALEKLNPYDARRIVPEYIDLLRSMQDTLRN